MSIISQQTPVYPYQQPASQSNQPGYTKAGNRKFKAPTKSFTSVHSPRLQLFYHLHIPTVILSVHSVVNNCKLNYSLPALLHYTRGISYYLNTRSETPKLSATSNWLEPISTERWFCRRWVRTYIPTYIVGSGTRLLSAARRAATMCTLNGWWIGKQEMEAKAQNWMKRVTDRSCFRS